MTMTEITNMQLGISIGTLVGIAFGFWKIVRTIRGYKDELYNTTKKIDEHIKDSDKVQKWMDDMVVRMSKTEIDSKGIQTDLDWIKTVLMEIKTKLK